MFKTSINKIIIIFAILVSIPAIILSIDEISSLNATEKVIDQVYHQQLNTILNMVDQFSYDVVNNWTRKINLLVVDSKYTEPNRFDKDIKDFLKLNPTIQMILLSDLNHPDKTQLHSILEDSTLTKFELFWKNIINKNNKNIKEVVSFHQDSIRIIKPVYLGNDDKEEIFYFPLDYTKDSTDYCCILINTHVFIRKILAPQIKTISHNEFTVSITDKKTNKEILSSNGKKLGRIQQMKDLSLFPNYSTAIFFKKRTIASLVNERSRKYLVIVLLIDVILFAGIWLLLKNLRKEIELSRIRANFVANVSHELRTPLSLINMFAETLVLDRVSSPEKKKEYYSIIHHETNRISSIVNKILLFNKIQEDKKIYNFKPSNLNFVLENIIDNYSYHLSNSGFSFSFEKDDTIPNIKIDEEAVAEAVINLIDNSVKYCNDNKVIKLLTGKDKNYVFVKVIDSGIGISIENQKKIFDKFYRVQKKSESPTKGTGLGLTIVKSIMDAHNGLVEVESSEGKGSCFILKFPVNS